MCVGAGSDDREMIEASRPPGSRKRVADRDGPNTLTSMSVNFVASHATGRCVPSHGSLGG
jgi:hypothetical protein